jgi:hypothetical protein
MQYFDICNGDADGLIARHQFRLAFPAPAERMTLITGTKRDISLLSQVSANAHSVNGAEISVFDISFDQNAEQTHALLEAGATVRYFDHHRASKLSSHPRLTSHIDTSPSVCTSLIVDRYLNGAYRAWAISAAFGDNLQAVAAQLSADACLTADEVHLLQALGESINYNSYGETVSDLHYPPAEIANRMAQYRSPFDFATEEDILSQLRLACSADLELARANSPVFASSTSAVFILPDASWARRVSGIFANELVRGHPFRAHAVLNTLANGTFLVSIRAPQITPLRADDIAIQFNGGGRASAAGINQLPHENVKALISLLEETYRSANALCKAE